MFQANTTDDLSAVLVSAAQDVLAVEGVTVGDPGPRRPMIGRNGRPPVSQPDPLPIDHNAVRLRGRLLLPSDQAYEILAKRLEPQGLTPVLRKGDQEGEVVITTLPVTFRQSRPNIRLAGILFGLTVMSCLFTGAVISQTGPQLSIVEGVPFAASLLVILLAHEFGHYLTARRLGVPVSLPYFIPFLPPLGTMGAVINMPAPPRNRRQLLSIGAAGPLCGLVVAIPILWIGLSLSQVQPLPPTSYQLEGNSLLYALLKYLRFGRFLPSGGVDVFIHPVAFAGWAGLLVTSLNLLPAGQLDGGHISFALLGEKWAGRILWVVMAMLAVLSFFWLGWLLWLGIVFLFSRLRTPLLDDVTALTPGQRMLGAFMLIVFVLVFMPVPWTVISR